MYNRYMLNVANCRLCVSLAFVQVQATPFITDTVGDTGLIFSLLVCVLYLYAECISCRLRTEAHRSSVDHWSVVLKKNSGLNKRSYNILISFNKHTGPF